MQNEQLLELKGSIEQVIYANEEKGYAVCDLGTEDNELVTIQGTLPYISEGDNVTVYGRWIHSPKYGRQFAVERYERNLPADANSILRYLSSRAIKGIGPKTKDALLAHFKSVKRIKAAAPEELEAVIGKHKAEMVIEGLKNPSLP